MHSIVTFILLLVLLSCQSKIEPEPRQYSVPNDVEPYVRAFRDQARQRGLVITGDNLIITFGKTANKDACGQCLRAAGKTPRITLNTDALCWGKANEQEREALIFHELGHCWLNRDHRSDRFANGTYVSLMNPNDVRLYAVCNYPIGDDVCDKRPRRGYYHNELFDPATPTPDWAK